MTIEFTRNYVLVRLYKYQDNSEIPADIEMPEAFARRQTTKSAKMIDPDCLACGASLDMHLEGLAFKINNPNRQRPISEPRCPSCKARHRLEPTRTDHIILTK